MTMAEKILARKAKSASVAPGDLVTVEVDMGPAETCITSSTRNFKGRMGDPTARVFMGSTATVAASAITGVITDPRELIA